MPFDPDHTAEGAKQREEEKMWKKLKETDSDRRYMKAMRDMQKLVRETFRVKNL